MTFLSWTDVGCTITEEKILHLEPVGALFNSFGSRVARGLLGLLTNFLRGDCSFDWLCFALGC